MLKIKSLLLASIATLGTVGAASAADLPAKKVAPVEFVRICSTYGRGFFFIPGTDTCLRVGGRVRAEYQYVSTNSYIGARANGDAMGFRGFGRLNLDARTSTDLGTVRAFVRFDISSGNGPYLRSGTAERRGTAFSGTGIDTFGRNQMVVNAEKAFIQFAGFTAGRAASFFDFYAGDLEFHLATSNSSTPSTNLFAYTATLGNGLSATLSVEDPIYRRQPIYTSTGGTISGTGPGTVAVNSAFFTQVPITFDPITGLPTTFSNLDSIQRERVPDVVGVLRLDQDWGSAQVSAAMHEINTGRYSGGALGAGNPGLFTVGALGAGAPILGSGGLTNTSGALAAGGQFTAANADAVLTANPVRVPESEYGFSVQAGVKINLPQLASGDVLWIQGAYGHGALDYVGSGTALWAKASNTNPASGRFVFNTNDAVVDRFGRLRLTESASITAAMLHYWTPQFRQAAFGSYGFINYDGDLRSGNGPANIIALSNSVNPVTRTTFLFNPVLKDTEFYTVGTNFIYSPVKDLDIGIEFTYGRVDIDGRVNDANKNPRNLTNANGEPLRTASNDELYLVRARVQRDF